MRTSVVIGMIWLCAPSASLAQSADHSRAHDDTLWLRVRRAGASRPVPNAIVQQLDGNGLVTGTSVAADASGSARVPLGTHRAVVLRIRALGYSPRTVSIGPDTLHGSLALELTPDSLRLQNVCVTPALSGITVRFARDVLQRGSMVRAIAQEGTYGDTATREVTVSDPAIGLAIERTGTYTLKVSVPGFREWRRRGIRVRRSAAPCHFLRTVKITPRLRRP